MGNLVNLKGSGLVPLTSIFFYNCDSLKDVGMFLNHFKSIKLIGTPSIVPVPHPLNHSSVSGDLLYESGAAGPLIQNQFI